ncbi:MAG: FxsA family protein [Spirochaetaceae bacterium]|nr:MAG: FxsA family protein [Spirochaetaceae bacterium]
MVPSCPCWAPSISGRCAERVNAEWLVLFTSRKHLATFFSNLLLLAIVVLADGWILVNVARRIGVYAALALEGAVALAAVIILGNSINHRIRVIREEARAGFFRPARYARLASVVTAAILLILPGFASDVLGLLIYYPPGRLLFSAFFLRRHRETLPVVYEYLKLSIFSDEPERGGAPAKGGSSGSAGEVSEPLRE